MEIEVRAAELVDVKALRELYREEARCQIVHDSALPRELAEPWLVFANGRTAGYGGVWNAYYEGRVVEFYVLPHLRSRALELFDAFLETSGATAMEAQTNVPLMLILLYDRAREIREEKVLFADGARTRLECPGADFRRSRPEDGGPDGEWVLEVEGEVVAAGGALYHYNPPWGDLYMEVVDSARRRGYGSYLVQELKRVCWEAGRIPAARCDPDNVASRRTLEKAGMLPCGRLLTGEVALRPASSA